MSMRVKVAFIHNYYVHYRVPLFKMLSKIFTTKFFFDDIHRFVEKIETGLNYKINFGIKLKEVKLSLFLWADLLHFRPDVIIAGDATLPSTIIGFIVSKLLKKPFILWEERWLWPLSIVGRLLWPISRFITLRSDVLVVPGTLSKKFYDSVGVSKSKIIIAPNACHIYLSKGYKSEVVKLRRSLALDNKFVILYFGRIVPYKAAHLIIKALNKLVHHEGYNNVHLLVIGGESDNYYRKLLEKYVIVNKIKDNVTILGFVEEKKKALFYKLADVVVFTPYYETWGFVVSEAMYCGKPIISTTTCACAYDLIKNRYNGFLIKPGDVNSLCGALSELIINWQLRQNFGKKARQAALKYSYYSMLKGFVKAIILALRKNRFT